MDTKEIATLLGTEPKILRRFLRSPACPFQSVGSGARYSFTKAQIDELKAGFVIWSKGKIVVPRPRQPKQTAQRQLSRDQQVWEDEARRGKVIVLEDIRDPRVRAKVKRIAREQEERLMQRLLAKGLHITQMRDRVS